MLARTGLRPYQRSAVAALQLPTLSTTWSAPAAVAALQLRTLSTTSSSARAATAAAAGLRRVTTASSMIFQTISSITSSATSSSAWQHRATGATTGGGSGVRAFSSDGDTSTLSSVRVPQHIDNCTVAEWYYQDGEIVKAGQDIVQLETEKTVIELQATRSGALSILCSAGSKATTNTALCAIEPSSRAGDGATWGTITVKSGEKIVIWNGGVPEVVAGPVWRFVCGGVVESLRQYIANANKYLAVEYQDGTQENLRGPCHVWWDPLKHRRIQIRACLLLDANELVVSYSRDAEGVSRRLIAGPTVHMPMADEWIHDFSWKESSALHQFAYGTKFNIIKTLPDQLEVRVPLVRTLDSAEVTIDLILFMRLVDVETMLEATHDPMSNLRVSLTADVIDFVSRLTLLQLKAQTCALNDPASYPQTLARAPLLGYEVSNVVLVGQTHSIELNDMLKQSMITETKLKVMEQQERQKELLTDIAVEKELARDLQRKQAQEATDAMDRTKRASDAALSLEMEQTRFQQERAHNVVRMTDRRLHLAELHGEMNVDVTALLIAQSKRDDPDHYVRIRTDAAATSGGDGDGGGGDGGGGTASAAVTTGDVASLPSQIHLHMPVVASLSASATPTEEE
jgi:biotin carboxyl carrier protein